MHALQKGLVEKDYCLALVQCNFVVRLCFKFNCTALAQCILVLRLFQIQQLRKLRKL